MNTVVRSDLLHRLLSLDRFQRNSCLHLRAETPPFLRRHSLSLGAAILHLNDLSEFWGAAQIITELPFEARNVIGLLAVQPGVVYLGEPDPAKLNDNRSGAVNGGKSDQAN